MIHFITKTLVLSFLVLLTFNSCKKTKPCQGTNSISGVLKNGTTMQGIKNVQLEFQIYDYNYARDKGENYKTLGTIMTDDTGGFYFEYPCQEKNYGEIAIDALPPYGGYLTAREKYSTKFGPKVYYYATNGSAQTVLQPLKPLGNDTLYVGLAEVDNSAEKWVYLDTFVNSVPNFWVKHRSTVGGGRGIYWGRGKVEFNKKKKFVKFNITGDPTIDSVFIKY